MTISEHLQFSVLTAPIASFDRRGLSQAWYSALYGNGASSSQAAPPSAKGHSQIANATHSPARAQSEPQAYRATLALNGQTRVAARGAEPERRSPRSVLARKIERAFLHPRAHARKASFDVEGPQGRVRVLLQSRGSRMRLVAICSPKAKAQVAAALAQARYALAARGIDLDAQLRGEAPC